MKLIRYFCSCVGCIVLLVGIQGCTAMSGQTSDTTAGIQSEGAGATGAESGEQPHAGKLPSEQGLLEELETVGIRFIERLPDYSEERNFWGDWCYEETAN